MAVNFTKYQDVITKAWRSVVDCKDQQNWALYGYEGNTNAIKLTSTGSDGLKNLVRELNCSLIQYAFCRVIEPEYNLNKLVLINWQGDASPLSRKGICASHVSDVANYFKGCSQTITIRNDDEATAEYLMEQIVKTTASSAAPRIGALRQQSSCSIRTSSSPTDQATSNSNQGSSSLPYKTVDISSDLSIDRKSFWKRQEEEEKERLLEEKRRAEEKRAQFEKERKLREESEAKRLAETIKERDRIIEATRQAEKRQITTSASNSRLKTTSNQQPTGAAADNSSQKHDTDNNKTNITATHKANQEDDKQNNEDDEHDERVGRRSEIIRLERAQETLSLISKGSIKDKRAIFEQASQKQDHQPAKQVGQTGGNSTIARRSSCTMVAQRLNSFKSLNTTNATSPASSQNANAQVNGNSDKDLDQLRNGVAGCRVSEPAPPASNSSASSSPRNSIVTKQVQTIKLTNNSTLDHGFISTSSTTTVTEHPVSPAKSQALLDSSAVAVGGGDAPAVVSAPSADKKQQQQPTSEPPLDDIQPAAISQNGNGVTNGSTPTKPVNENNNHILSKSPKHDAITGAAPTTPQQVTNNEPAQEEADNQVLLLNGADSGVKARALYDYQAADGTEISFDPGDVVGRIDKVDPGWWHGTVITGQFRGQTGLFPANYVEELPE